MPHQQGEPARARPDGGGPVASRSKITITVTSTRGGSQVNYTTNGRYASLNTNTLGQYLPSEPLFTTATPQAYWLAVLAAVTAAVTAGPPS